MSGPASFLLLLLLVASSSSSQEDLVRRNSDFAARLFRSVASRTDENVVVSPLALSTALTALASAAAGTTQEQLLKGLGLTGLEPATVTDLLEKLQHTITGRFQQGVAVLPDNALPVSQTFLDLVQSTLGGTVQKVAYESPQDATDIINRWAQEQTGDRLQELVTNLDPRTQLLLAAIASYQARFDPPFNASLSQDERFYVDQYHVAVVAMMLRADKYFLAYDRALKAGVLKLPMTDGAAMLVVFPDEGVDVATVEEEVTSEKIQAWIGQLKKTKLEVQLPRFLLERAYSLKDVLQSFDITQVFGDDADLSNMGGATGAALTQVLHRSVVSADESVDDITAAGGSGTFSSPPPRLTINRPFLFVIYQQDNGSLLSLGRVADPTKK